MPESSIAHFVGGRLSVDFCNELRPLSAFPWEDLLRFLSQTRVISGERSGQLLALPESDPQSADLLLRKARRLQSALDSAFTSMTGRELVPRESVELINQILRITEGHDELVPRGGRWHLEFSAREGGLDWLLAAVARSAAEIVAEGSGARLRLCANPACGLFFYDNSRTKQRRWCSMTRCGNRHKVAAFSRRRTAAKRENED